MGNAPCIVFIDEIDAVGRQRAGGGRNMGGGNDEREQTLNQILTEMDGFEGNSGVIVLAATNRADVLDSALTRPGRFDRRVPVDLPDLDGRSEILKVHCKGKPLADNVDMQMVAKRTTGFSGASLANLMNEAAIVAARRDKSEITYDEIDFAIDRITVGMVKETGTSFPARQRLVAYHEAGHAIMGALTPDYDQVAKVTILPRSNGAGGFTLFAPSEEMLSSGLYSKRYLKGQLAVALGGRVVEEIVYGKGGFGPQGASLETEQAIDEQVTLLVADAYKVCYKTLNDNRDLVEELTEMLLEEETVDYVQLEALVKKYHPNGVGSEVVPLPAVAKMLRECFLDRRLLVRAISLL